MRHRGNIFESESYRGNAIRTVSNLSVITIILTLISSAAAVYIVANFGDITARIAIWMARFLTSGFLILITILIGIYCVVKLKWRMRRFFWR